MALQIPKHPSPFETKYVFTLLDRVLINTWRAEVAVNVVKPWLAQLNKMGKERPSFVQVRRKVQHNVTIDDFVEKFSIIYLQYLQKQVVSPTLQTKSLLSVMGAMNNPKLLVTPTNLLPNMTTTILSRKDQDVLAVIDELKIKKQWPKQRDRLK